MLLLMMMTIVIIFIIIVIMVSKQFVFFSEEYVAHTGNVRSLCLGQSSGRLLATGGEDNQIKMWSLDKPNCIMVSLFDIVSDRC